MLSPEAQSRLSRSTALVTRVGGMGGPAAMMLAMSGIGKLILAHGGELISPDLNRQVLGSEAGLGKPRVTEFAARLRELNRWVEVEAIDHEPSEDEAFELACRADVVLACPPTFAERLRLNRAACSANKPLIDAAQWGMTGTLAVYSPGKSACLECVYPQEPPFEEFFPVIGAISSAIGSLAALEAIKILSQTGQPLWGKMFLMDGFQGATRMVDLTRRADCPVCGRK